MPMSNLCKIERKERLPKVQERFIIDHYLGSFKSSMFRQNDLHKGADRSYDKWLKQSNVTKKKNEGYSYCSTVVERICGASGWKWCSVLSVTRFWEIARWLRCSFSYKRISQLRVRLGVHQKVCSYMLQLLHWISYLCILQHRVKLGYYLIVIFSMLILNFCWRFLHESNRRIS